MWEYVYECCQREKEFGKVLGGLERCQWVVKGVGVLKNVLLYWKRCYGVGKSMEGGEYVRKEKRELKGCWSEGEGQKSGQKCGEGVRVVGIQLEEW